MRRPGSKIQEERKEKKRRKKRKKKKNQRKLLFSQERIALSLVQEALEPRARLKKKARIEWAKEDLFLYSLTFIVLLKEALLVSF